MRKNIHDELGPAEAKSLARDVLENGRIIFSNHAEKRMLERGYGRNDVFHILLYGHVTKVDQGRNNTWVYTFRGEDLEGDDGGVVITFIESFTGLIITVLG